jgi:hypothetical protein
MAWILVLVLLAAAAYELAIALQWISMGRESGQEARGQAPVTIAAFGALVVGIALSAVAAGGRRVPRGWGDVLVPGGAAAYVTAHYYAFDAYYLPTLRRFCDGGSVSAAWLYGVVLCVLAVSAAVWIRPRLGLALVPPALLACAFTVGAMGVGH